MSRNLATSLRVRPRARAMAAFDALPREARRWAAQARLPWSPASVRRIWRRALDEAQGDVAAALARLDAAEARLLARDAARVWGPRYPPAPPGAPPPPGAARPRPQAATRRPRAA